MNNSSTLPYNTVNQPIGNSGNIGVPRSIVNPTNPANSNNFFQAYSASGSKIAPSKSGPWSPFGYATSMSGKINYDMPTYNGKLITPQQAPVKPAASQPTITQSYGEDLDSILAQMYQMYGISNPNSSAVTTPTATNTTAAPAGDLTPRITPNFGMTTFM